jgi:hypothetical protein
MVTIKNTEFASALAWEAIPSGAANRKGISARSKALQIEVGGYVLVRGGDNTLPSVGFYKESEGYSLEATIAAGASESAIYVIHLDDNNYMLLIVDDRMLLSGSGFTGTLDDVISEIESSARIVLPKASVYCTDPVAIATASEWDPIDIESIIDLDKKVPIEKLANQSSLVKPLIIAGSLVIAGGAAFYGWQMMKHVPTITKEQRDLEAKRQLFMNQQTNMLNHFKEKDSDWIYEAAEKIDAKYAINGFGWNFTGAECTRSGCNLIWSSLPNENAYYAPFIKMLKIDDEKKGAKSTKLVANSTGADIKAQVGLPEPKWLMLSSKINELPEANQVRERLWDFKQVMESRYGLDVQPSKQGEANLVPGVVPPGIIMVVKKGSLSAAGQNRAQLYYFAKALDAMGMYATKLVYSPGTSTKVKQQWKVEASYVTR